MLRAPNVGGDQTIGKVSKPAMGSGPGVMLPAKAPAWLASRLAP
jgi:hypothetical protein